MPLIVCGDFNTTPESPAIQLMQSDLKSLSPAEHRSKLLHSSVLIAQQGKQEPLSEEKTEAAAIALRSAYGSKSEHLTYSTWKIRSPGEVKRVIDYMFLSGKHPENQLTGPRM